MTNSNLYDLFTFGSHTGSHLELKSYARFANVAKTRIVQATMDITYHFIEKRLSTIMVINYLSLSSGHPRMPNFNMFLQQH